MGISTSSSIWTSSTSSSNFIQLYSSSSSSSAWTSSVTGSSTSSTKNSAGFLWELATLSRKEYCCTGAWGSSAGAAVVSSSIAWNSSGSSSVASMTGSSTGATTSGTSTAGASASSSICRNLGDSAATSSETSSASNSTRGAALSLTAEALILSRKVLSMGLGLTVPSSVTSPTVAWYSVSTVVPLGTLLKRLLTSSAFAWASPTSMRAEVLSAEPTKLPPVALTMIGSPSLKRAFSGTLEMKISPSSSMLYFSYP